jgi:hypothetical protein
VTEPDPWNLDGRNRDRRRDGSKRGISQAPINHRIRADDFVFVGTAVGDASCPYAAALLL